MARPIGLLRAGYPYLKTLGMRRITNFPYDVAFGADETVYVLLRTAGVAEIRVWTFDDAEQLTDDLVSIGGSGKEAGQFEWPVQIITNEKGQIFVSDEANHKISIFNPDGEFVSRWGTVGSDKGEFVGPAGISFNREGDLLVVDARTNRIQTYSQDGEFKSQFGNAGDAPGEFQNPWGIHVDENGFIYVADWGNDRVQVLSPDGDPQIMISGATPDGLKIKNPTGVAVDDHGDIYISDWGNNRVLQYDSSGRYVWRFLGDASLSRAARTYMLTNARSNRIREMANLEEEKYLRFPTSVRIDSQFRLCIADHHRYRLQVYQKEAIELDQNTISEPLRNHTLSVN